VKVPLASLFKNDRGVALILTIMVVSFIIALSLEFNRNMRNQVVSAGNIGHGLKALYAAKSGISHGFVVLKTDPREWDSLQDDWADTEKLTALGVTYKGLLGGSSFDLKIEDLSGRIPINLVVDNDKVKEVFTRLLENEDFDLDSDTINTILDSTMDWIDEDSEDDLYRLNGAESDHYLSLDKPYQCKNGPLDDPEELLLVNGVTPELFFGTAEKTGIGKCITVYGGSEVKINLNTAHTSVLDALSNDYDGESLAGFREDATEAELETGDWFKGKINKNYKSIAGTKSAYFKATSSGQFGSTKKKVVSVVKRDPDNGEIRTLSWKIE
jgi:general secretion pathway protein K